MCNKEIALYIFLFKEDRQKYYGVNEVLAEDCFILSCFYHFYQYPFYLISIQVQLNHYHNYLLEIALIAILVNNINEAIN
jgi:hypothetical protein